MGIGQQGWASLACARARRPPPAHRADPALYQAAHERTPLAAWRVCAPAVPCASSPAWAMQSTTQRVSRAGTRTSLAAATGHPGMRPSLPVSRTAGAERRAAPGARLADVVAAKVHEHDVLRPLLAVRQQLVLQRGVRLGRVAAPPRARQRPARASRGRPALSEAKYGWATTSRSEAFVRRPRVSASPAHCASTLGLGKATASRQGPRMMAHAAHLSSRGALPACRAALATVT
jgi:hypothetical protein